jgi:thioredoxin 1
LLKKHIRFMRLLVLIVLTVAVLMACGNSPLQGGERPSLVYFRIDNCPYCKEMTPIVDEIARQYGQQLDVVYAQVDRQDGKQLANQYGVIGYPTILLLDSEGERVGLLSGVVPRPALEKMVDELLQEGR